MKRLGNIFKSKWVWLYIIIAVVTVALNIIAWNSTAFCDAYIANIFQIWVNTYGRLTGLVPFSVGEIMLVLAVVLVVLAAVLWIPVAIKKLAGELRKQEEVSGRKGTGAEKVSAGSEEGMAHAESSVGKGLGKRVSIWVGAYYKFFAWTSLIVCLVMTLNCTILYHASTFSKTYFEEASGEEYSLEDLIIVRNLVVEQCERLSRLMERDEAGTILYGKDIGEQAIGCMQELGETYERLQGFYPHPKPLAASDFFSQQRMCGYYFPFSMEANYNDVMYIMNKPSTMCHELAHLRGYIFEDEANFISFLACIQSDDPMFEYSGYLSVLYYLDNDFYDAVGRKWDVYSAQPAISAQVHADNIFLTDEEWDRINGKALIDTEVVDEISDVVVDTTLKVNGVSDGMISYNRVVELLLQYYKLQGVLD